MPSEIAIRVSHLSKCYQIYDRPQHRLWQSVLRGRKQFFREFWALHDVSFEVKKGETVGIVGKNGSGKSTLLQIICGTLSPTSGTVQTNGRIAALLELGAGFNLEFTGRENVFMNAAILGLTRAEIDSRLDQILAFADIGEFVDQPVKTYSSGMFVRLAFSVAVHVDPQILIVDEALSVGDLAFQNKCIAKIKALRDGGTTLLFVAHDLSILQMICDRVAWLRQGEIVTIGGSIAVCQEYYADSTGKQSTTQLESTVIPQKNTGMATFIDVTLEDASPGINPVFSVGDAIRFKFGLRAEQALGNTVYAVSVFRADGDWAIGQTSLEDGVFWPPMAVGGIQRGRLVLNPNCLAPGDYLAAFGAYSEDLSICYALSDLNVGFSVRWNFPTWGRFIHPCQWIPSYSEPGTA
jgi:ABC-type polysaccharide/polyol phosphate transport system ATPase subunit